MGPIKSPNKKDKKCILAKLPVCVHYTLWNIACWQAESSEAFLLVAARGKPCRFETCWKIYNCIQKKESERQSDFSLTNWAIAIFVETCFGRKLIIWWILLAFPCNMCQRPRLIVALKGEQLHINILLENQPFYQKDIFSVKIFFLQIYLLDVTSSAAHLRQWSNLQLNR